jgi:amidohydrolase
MNDENEINLSEKLIREKINAIYPKLVSIRRDIHKYPELGFEEKRTGEIIVEILEELDFKIYKGIAKTGIIGQLKGKKTGPTIAFRADMDALPIQEKNNISYASKVPGKMHACGHDGHVSILLGAAKIFAKIKDKIPGQIILIFQPAEEGPGGAMPIIESGILNNFNIEAIFGLHIFSTLPKGKISIKEGAITSSVDNFVLNVKGKSSHGAHPETGIDAVLVACQIVNNLQCIVSREISSNESAVVTVGKIEGGYRRNVIADNVSMEGTIRCTSPKTRKLVEAKFKRIIKGVTSAYGAEYELNYKYGYPSTINDKRMTDLVRKTSEEVVGENNVIKLNNPELVGEDVSYFLKKFPGCFFYLGGAIKGQKIVPHHSPYFNFEESAMKLGVEMFVKIALNYFKNKY